jgi:hypothetical protein
LVRVEQAPGEPFDHGVFEIVEEDWPAAERERARAVVEGTEQWLLDAPAAQPPDASEAVPPQKTGAIAL